MRAAVRSEKTCDGTLPSYEHCNRVGDDYIAALMRGDAPTRTGKRADGRVILGTAGGGSAEFAHNAVGPTKRS